MRMRAALRRACRACARRRARPCRARAAASRPARARRAAGSPSAPSTSAGREPACTSQSSISAQRAGSARLAGDARRARPRRSPRAARAPRARGRARRRRRAPAAARAATSQSTASRSPVEALDVAPPALAPGVDEVERGAAAEPVPVRRAARERAVGDLRDHNRMIRHQRVTRDSSDDRERGILTRTSGCPRLAPRMSDLMAMTVGELAAPCGAASCARARS